jgi:hypothetical protein
VAAIVEGTIDIAMPAAVSSPGTMMYTIPLPLEPIRASSSMPGRQHHQPAAEHRRTPKAHEPCRRARRPA